MECAPFESAAIAAYPSKTAWDAASTELVVTMLDRWHLTAVRGMTGGYAASAFEVVQSDGTPAVLKIGFPHTEAIWEAVALEAMGPELAPSVIRQDPWTWAMLLSDVLPGTPVSQLSTDDAISVGASILRRMRATATPVGPPTVDTEVRDFIASALARRGVHAPRLAELQAKALVDRAFEVGLELLDRPVAYSLVHGDLNPTNVLRHGESRWLAIDPKPMIGDPAYDVGPLIGQLDGLGSSPHPDAELRRRSELMAALTDLPTDRIVSWGLVRAALSLCWFIDDEIAAVSEHGEADRAVAELRAWAGAAEQWATITGE